MSDAVRDPVCGMPVDPASGRSAVDRGRTFFFCSEYCRRCFLARPDRYRYEAPGAPAPELADRNIKEAPERSGAAATPRRTRSLVRRLRGWTIAVFTSTLAVFTAAGILEERREILRNEADEARAFVEHVAQMPAFGSRSTFGEAARNLTAIRDLLRAAGADLEMVPRFPRQSGKSAAGESASGILATRKVSLADGAFELRYRKDPMRFRQMTVRSVMIHVLHGVLALAALVAGAEWILRRRLVAPLARISHQVDHMRQGGGWLTILPQTDAELDALAGAVKKLGPGLEQQVHQWVEAERRAAVALVLNDVRNRLRGPLREVRALAGDLSARNLLVPAGKRKVRSLLADLDRVDEVLEAEARLSFGPRPPCEAPPDRPGSARGASP